MTTTLLNYTILQVLYDSENSLVYRALRNVDKQPVILKCLKADLPSATQLARYQQEYELLRQLPLPGIIQVYTLEHWQDHLMLVLEDFGGESLTHWLQQRALTVTENLSLAIQIADSLGKIHAANIIHKDINPANIVWNPSTGQLKLIDFGIATRLPRETLALQNPNQLEGTLAYLSPEQTGRMNRALDYRTDLYSLGVTCYEMFTGRLPFETPEAMELVHCHLAKQPIPPHHVNAEIPLVISHLILRLLAKAAEERYQSAWGVKADLEQILSNLTGLQDLSGFQLGQRDFSDRFHLPQKLYGRAAELQQLLATFEEVTTGASQWLLIAGYSGIGKTALIQEIYRPITEKRGYFIAGKFDQFQRNVPYSAVMQAFGDLMRQLLTETQVQLDSWKTEILTAVGHNGQVIIDVIPEVELILGPQPAVPTLPPTESQNRFNLVFQNFLQVFCQADHPLVMFLDDLQWVDAASLKLMTLMMNDIPSLLLIGAYRDNEVSPVHPLMTTIEEMQKQGLLVQTLTLTPLTLPHLNQLVSDTLHLPVATTLPLTDLVMAKTGGNPFFVGEFLKTLHVEQLLDFNRHLRQWQWDLTQIQAHNITDNVVELMTGKIRRLQLPVQQVLTLAAAIGNQFDLATLATVSQQSSEWVKTQLWEALVEGLVVPIGETYKFVHDRVQQAAYSLIPEGERTELHWRIGQLLLNQPQIVEDRLFEVVDHLNLGQALADTPTAKIQMACLNLQAGQKAKSATAYQSAYKYLRVGLSLLASDSWQTDYQLTLSLSVELTEVAYLNEEFEAMEHFAQKVMANVQVIMDKVQVYEIRMQHHALLRQFLKGLLLGLEALSVLGVPMLTDATLADIGEWLTRTQTELAKYSLAQLLDLPVMTDPAKLAAMRLLIRLNSHSYVARPILFPLIVCQGVLLSLQYGNSVYTSAFYVNYGLVLCSPGIDNYVAGSQYSELGQKLFDKYPSPPLLPMILNNSNLFVVPWYRHNREVLAPLRECYRVGLEVGDLEFTSYAVINYLMSLYYVGTPLPEVDHECETYIAAVRRFKHVGTLNYDLCYHQMVLNLMGKDGNPPWELNGRLYSEPEMLHTHLQGGDHAIIAIHYSNKLTLAYLFGQYDLAQQTIEPAEQHMYVIGGRFPVMQHCLYASLVELTLADPTVDLSPTLAKVESWQNRLKRGAEYAPMNFQHKYDLVAAEQARVLGNYWQAAQLYEKAITGARENEYLQEEALAYELAAKFYLAQGLDKIAHLYLTDAYHHYQRWGATAKLTQLAQQYPQWLPPQRAAISSITFTPTGTTLPLSSISSTRLATSTDWLDLTSVLKAAQALSDEMVLEKLLTNMMHTVIENAGAQRGVLILEDHGHWVMQAELTVQPETITVLQAVPLDGQVPTSLLNYVIRTKQSIVLADYQKETKYQTDDYVRTHSLKSVLCLTLLHQQQLVGVIYLENNLTTGVFTPARFQVLTLLSSQMAISLDNARFVRELQQARQVAEAARQAAEVANQAKTAFLANVSHELRTPLNGILGYTQLLQQDSQLTVTQQDWVKVIHRSGEHLLVMVSDILDISKLQTAKLELQLTDVYLSPLLTELANWFRDQAQEKGLFFHYKPAFHLPMNIVADGKRLRQILLHLLSNAVKFTQRGSILFQIDSTPLANRPGWHHFQFTITDTGIGITEANLAKLFTPFEQASDWLHKTAGAGLGLSLAKQLIDLMGGHIQVNSSLDQGSTFTVLVDLAASKEWQSVSTPERILDLSETSPATETLGEATTLLKGPTAAQAAELYNLSQMGDFMGILELVDQLEQENEELRPFVAKVRQLAKEFRDGPIEKLARQFM